MALIISFKRAPASRSGDIMSTRSAGQGKWKGKGKAHTLTIHIKLYGKVKEKHIL